MRKSERSKGFTYEELNKDILVLQRKIMGKPNKKSLKLMNKPNKFLKING